MLFIQNVWYVGGIRKVSTAPHVKLRKLIKPAGCWSCFCYRRLNHRRLCALPAKQSCQFDSRSRRRYTTYYEFGAWFASLFRNNRRTFTVASLLYCRTIIARAVRSGFGIILLSFVIRFSYF